MMRCYWVVIGRIWIAWKPHRWDWHGFQFFRGGPLGPWEVSICWGPLEVRQFKLWVQDNF
jgi:hypothetical protein